MSLRRCEMRWSRPPPADGPRTYRSSKHLNIEGPTSDQSVSCSGKHDVAVDGGTMRNFWGLCSLYLFCQRSVMIGSATHVADSLSHNL